METVFAVVLTYNRKDLLRRCLDAIYAQSRPCDGVLVIDNGSSDGTEQMLLDTPRANLKCFVLSHNIGASGGFNAGFRLAYQHGADFVWMMDDDVIPAEDALQQLLDADRLLERQGIARSFLLSTAYTESGLITNSPDLDMRRNRIDYEDWPRTLAFGLVPVRRGTFVSILVPRATIAEHGLPIASMFIWGEDTEYTLRMTQQVPGFLVGASKVLHLRQEHGALSIVTENNPARLKYHRHRARNELFVARKYYRQRRLILSMAYQLSLMFKLLGRGQFARAQIVLRGLLESLWFSPATEAVDAPIERLGVSIRTAQPVMEVESDAELPATTAAQ